MPLKIVKDKEPEVVETVVVTFHNIESNGKLILKFDRLDDDTMSIDSNLSSQVEGDEEFKLTLHNQLGQILIDTLQNGG